MDNQETSTALSGKTVAIPETRQLDVLAGLLERRGADVVRCPLVAILDAPDAEPVVGWIKNFIENPFDDFIIFTGEGIRRLSGFAERAGLLNDFIHALKTSRKIARGPKPGRALKEIGLSVDVLAEAPTTDGLIATLDKLDLRGRRLAVQLYGTEPNQKFMDYLNRRGVRPVTVAPYIYAPETDEDKVLDLLEKLAAGQIDVIVFTSQPQYTRLHTIASKHGKQAALQKSLGEIKVAAVGPVVAQHLKEAHVPVDIMPEKSFFMKPMVNELVAAIGK